MELGAGEPRIPREGQDLLDRLVAEHSQHRNAVPPRRVAFRCWEVFGDQPVEEILALAWDGGSPGAQLHGPLSSTRFAPVAAAAAAGGPRDLDLLAGTWPTLTQ